MRPARYAPEDHRSPWVRPVDEESLLNIVIAFANVESGYLNNPTATAETFQNGFFHTGDVGNIDEDGLFHIEDRIKEMIKVGV